MIASTCKHLIKAFSVVQAALQPAREARAHLKAPVGLDAMSALPQPPLTAQPAAVAAAAGSPMKAPLQVIVRIEDLALVVPVTSRCDTRSFNGTILKL